MLTSVKSSFLAQRYAIVFANTVFPIPGAPSIKINLGGLPVVASVSVELIKFAANILVMSVVTLE